MELTNITIWIFFQIALDVVLVGLLLLLIRNMKSGLRKEAAGQASEQVMEIMAPLIKEAESVAMAFEDQLKEKKRLVHRLNEDLDSRIISLNMLLNRAKSSVDEKFDTVAAGQVYQQQEAILELYGKDNDPETIAKKLSLPKGEVELVIDLKRKFQSTE